MPEKEIKLSVEQFLSMYQNQKAQLDALMQQINSLNSLLIETDMAQKTLVELSTPSKDEVMFSLGAGVFVDATVGDLKKVKSNIGGNVVEEMTVKKALERLEERKKGIGSDIKKLREQERGMVTNLMEMEKIFKVMEQQRQAAATKEEKEEAETPAVS